MINDKLREILQKYKLFMRPDTSKLPSIAIDECLSPSEVIDEIKQAFADEGWQQPTSSVGAAGRYKDGIYQGDLMTGQEFYDRFNKEVELLTKHVPELVKKMKDWNLNSKALAAIIGYDLDKAAKRAAGLDETH